MKTQDWLQLASLATVAVALFFSYLQTKNLSQQAGEAARQAAATASSLQHAAYRTVSDHGSQMYEILFGQNPGALEWFLRSRGIPTGSHDKNIRLYIMFQRMDVHESAYVYQRDGYLSADVWSGWQHVVEADAATPEFRQVWRAVRHQYAPDFVEHVDRVVARSAVTVPAVVASSANGGPPRQASAPPDPVNGSRGPGA